MRNGRQIYDCVYLLGFAKEWKARPPATARLTRLEREKCMVQNVRFLQLGDQRMKKCRGKSRSLPLANITSRVVNIFFQWASTARYIGE